MYRQWEWNNYRAHKLDMNDEGLLEHIRAMLRTSHHEFHFY